MNYYTKEEVDEKIATTDELVSGVIHLTRAELEDIKKAMLQLNERVKSLEAIIQKLKQSN